ncbi:nucleoside triphosphate pyrophosphohydrolase [Sphingosinicella sp. LHD-64]|uniref:nucleoside triphosphate pyrophosphohydrolase n=1 Tax=Sphingosinicella sp. LHD-64 TaxID=3072139 RepID=UPI0028107E90|nr:nucleoside triphosphate pyrophosphohydrolase [Sphingosinicella sp. LHD-64]MDQ8754793.1 nucleoside triphosphate pyrophosphohydrolase [Sphingosinicella sp. LHD-64]
MSLSDPQSPLAELVAIMARLRDPETGCEWDRAQSFETIAPYTIEEAYEVADAIARGDMAALEDELGDLQFQVVYHARMAEEAGAFAIDDVIKSICDKMIRRHPHIFGEAGASPGWEAIKAAERETHEDSSALAGIALALPALKRAEKIQRRAARVGFDWPDAMGPRQKIDEELEEIAQARNDEERGAEIGDLLFTVVNYARHLGVDPETALREANARFERRFRKVESLTDKPLKVMTLEELEALWQRAKKEAGSSSS